MRVRITPATVSSSTAASLYFERIMKRLLATLVLLGSSAAYAEEMYVNDKLVVNVYEQPDQASAKVDTLETGDSMEVLDRTEGGFAHVKLANGREGYVRASYLT